MDAHLPEGPVVRCGYEGRGHETGHWIPADEAEPYYPLDLTALQHDELSMDKSMPTYLCPEMALNL